MVSCSVIIVSYQSTPVIFSVIKQALEQQQLADVWVVDNGNSPAILTRLQQMSLQDPRLTILSGHGNVGVAQGYSLGARKAIGDYLLFLHADCLLPPDALVQAVAALEKEPQAMVAGAWLLNADGSEQVSGAPFLISPKQGIKHLLRFGRAYKPASFVPSSAFTVSAVDSVCMCLSRAHFKLMDGFSEDYFLVGHDLDLCRRVQNAGKQVIKLPQVQAVHLHQQRASAAVYSFQWKRTRDLMRYYKEHEAHSFFLVGRWLMNIFLLLRYVMVVKCEIDIVRHKNMGFADPNPQSTLRGFMLRFLAMGWVDIPESERLVGRRVLLTGATGQIGLCVLRRLVAAGASVVALSRQQPLPYFHERVQWVQGDLSDEGFELPQAQLDVVVHCAPLVHLPKFLVRLAGCGVTRMVAFGSTALFSQASSKNWHEKENVDRLREAEKATEMLCQQEQIDWTILRPTLVYGMEMDNGITWITRFIRRFRFFPVYPPAMGTRHPVHADDLAKAALLVLDNAKTYGKAYNLSGREVMSFHEMVERIFVACGRKKRVMSTTILPFALDVVGKLFHKKAINAEIAYRMNDDLVFFHDQARDDFGFSPRGFLHELEE